MRNVRDEILHVSVQEDRKPIALVVYDLKKGCVNDELTSFALHRTRVDMLDAKTAVNATYQVARFVRYLAEQEDISDRDLCDRTLLRYREKLMKEAPGRAKGTRTRTYRNTVNAALSAVYDWIRWLQDTGRAPSMTIGPAPSRVISNLVTQTRGGRALWSKPLLLDRAGKNSKHKPIGFVPDEQTREDVLEHLHSKASTDYLAERNALMQRVFERTGMRRGSGNSLLTGPFARERLDKSEYEAIDVQPPKQKFGYDNDVRVPLDLAYDICNFIETTRRQASKGPFPPAPSERVFLSEEGEPLEDRSVTAIFARAMRAAGAPRGAAVHAWRHAFVQAEVERELEYRLAMGLDANDDAICAAVSVRVGHTNPESLKPYLASAHSKRRSRRKSARSSGA
ncbi:hypothetical protein [Variovorax sp. J22R115]|uniref:hypothetical protein n=1 Tax=Variovorax sp. J22R115 TaxID=3053509 RepID=UPI002575D3AA|nr:hypothetical protein [Variovorax sp. J22R115]MDM0053991.1 hypothetical protein [Variovorax sp. J22R115]